MTPFQRALLLVFSASCLLSLAGYFTGAHKFGAWATVPALLLSGLALGGHLITLDDDMPGEWANPGGSRKIWYQSIGQLFLKLVIFLSVDWLLSLHSQKPLA